MDTDAQGFSLASSVYLRTAAVRFLGRSSRDHQVRVDYEGQVARDEIKFTRTVAESIKEELVGKRAKESNASNP